MVKIVEVKEQHDAGPDDDCCEISLEEFAKKVSLKEDDDVILIAAKGKIVKVEADQLEDSAKAYDDCDTEAESSCIRGSGGRGQQAAAAGDCVDNPYKIDEDETSLLKVKVEDMFVIGKPSGGGDKNERSCNAANVIPGVLVPVVKCEPIGDNGVALRDFPHPRHLCGNFPFDTTHHESHCSKCYCSLCEVPASNCLNWEGTGGHCHATHRNK